jgi:hypothetical protein
MSSISKQGLPTRLAPHTYIPGLRDNLYRWFTVNLGIYIPAVAALHGGGLAKSVVHEYNCSIRARLGISGSDRDLWWAARAAPDVIDDVESRLSTFGLVFLYRFGSRELILSELLGHGENLPHCSTPRIVCAIILLNQGNKNEAAALMAAQATESRQDKHHPAYVRKLAERMGLGAV